MEKLSYLVRGTQRGNKMVTVSLMVSMKETGYYLVRVTEKQSYLVIVMGNDSMTVRGMLRD